MRICSHCGTEYDEAATCCATCSASELLSEAALNERRDQARKKLRGLDTVRLANVGSVDDPLVAELITRVLDAACIPVFANDPRGGSVGTLTTGIPHDWWEFWVPDVEQVRARELIERAKAQFTVDPDEAARAAEEEELASEQLPPSGAV